MSVAEPMKIASFNINDINRRLTNLLNWLREAEPDTVCLQELKATDTEFPAEAIREAGYHVVFRGERRWNGVAILARWAPVLTRAELPGGAADRQSRYLEAAVNGVLIASIYAPNGNPQPGPKFDYKLAWLDRLVAHAADLYASGAPVVLAGDYNVVPTDLDIYSTKSWDRDALLQPESRAVYRRLLSQGWTDAVRALHPKEPMYTFWDYMRNRCERDGGLRLDHILLSSALTVNTCKAPALTATSAEYHLIARLPDCFRWELGVRSLQFLEANRVGFRFAKPVQQVGQASVDVVDVETGDFHRFSDGHAAWV